MGGNGFFDIDQAKDLVRSAMDAVSDLRDGEFWKLGSEDLLTLGRQLERLSRVVHAATIHLAGEVDTQQLAKKYSCPSTAALLRQTLLISPAEANGRVNTARKILPQEILTGGELPPVLPALRTAVDAGSVGSEHVRTIVATMRKLPAELPVPDRDFWEGFLVDTIRANSRSSAERSKTPPTQMAPWAVPTPGRRWSSPSGPATSAPA